MTRGEKANWMLQVGCRADMGEREDTSWKRGGENEGISEQRSACWKLDWQAARARRPLEETIANMLARSAAKHFEISCDSGVWLNSNYYFTITILPLLFTITIWDID